MANLNRPFGFRPVRLNNGAAWNGEANVYVVLAADTSDYSIGELVMHGGTADGRGYPSAIKYVAGGSGATAPLGSIVGILPVGVEPLSLQGVALNLESKKLLGTSTIDRYILVVDSTEIIYEVQADATGLRRNAVGSNIDVTVASPSNPEQLSATVLNAATAAATATLPYRVVGFAHIVTNEVNATAATDEPFVITLVRPNEHAWKVGTVGLAV